MSQRNTMMGVDMKRTDLPNRSMRNAKAAFVLVVSAAVLSGCYSSRYEIVDDRGPTTTNTVNADTVADAVPQVEPLSRTGNAPYRVFGVRYTPLGSSLGYVEQGQASWYGEKFHGKKTSSGEPYDMYAMTAAHKTLPLPTYARVDNVDNGRSIVVKINDRGPFANNRIIDLSYVAAVKLGMADAGIGNVRVTALDPTRVYASNPAPAPGYSTATGGPVVAEIVDLTTIPGSTTAVIANQANAGNYAESAPQPTPQPTTGTWQTSRPVVTSTEWNQPQAGSTTAGTWSSGTNTNAGTWNSGGTTTSGTTSTAGTWNSGSASTNGTTGPWNAGGAATTGSTVVTTTGGAWNNAGVPPTPQTNTSGTWNNGNSQGTWQTTDTAVPQSTYTPAFGGQNIYVQVGAFGAMENAWRIKSVLDQRGFTPVAVTQINRGGMVLHRVRIGPIMTNALAESELMRLTNSVSIGGRPHIVVE